MTVETTTSKAGPYAGAGTVGPFPVPFRFLDASHLQVIRTDPNGNSVTLTLGADYSVQGVGQTTGAVTLTAALPSSFRLTVLRNVPATQEADYVPNDAFPAESHERALDKLTMLVQQQGEMQGRALTVPPTDPRVSLVLPEAKARAKRYLSFDDSGRPVATTFDVDAVAQASQAAQDAAAAAKVSEANAAGSASDAQDSADFAREQSEFVAKQVAATTPTVVRFSGDGAQSAYELPSVPGAEENTLVYISGVYQQKNTYEIPVGTGTLVFAEAPPEGVENIEVVIAPSVMLSIADAQDISFVGPDGIKRNVGRYLRDGVSKAVFQYDTFAEAEAAAARLPDGQVVVVADSGDAYIVLRGLLNAYLLNSAPKNKFDQQLNYVGQALGAWNVNAHIDVTAFPFLADRTGVVACDAAVNAAKDFVKSKGGGVVYLPTGDFLFSDHAVIETGVKYQGAGKGVTNVWVKAGSNCDAFKSKDFDALTGVGPAYAAPHHCAVVGLTIHGNYLDLGPTESEISWKDADTVLNTTGCGIRSFATAAEYDVEVINVADHALYSEAIGDYKPNTVGGLKVWIEGRISGYEGVVLRGPGDASIDYINFGLTGHRPRSYRATATDLKSRLYPNESVHGLVIDNDNYAGHCEIKFVHMYSNWYGYGIKTMGTCRFNAAHVVTDNCRGGFGLSNATHGIVAIAESRANGRWPDGFTGGSFETLPCADIANGSIWELEFHLKTSRYSPGRAREGYDVVVSGHNNLISITRQGSLQADGKSLRAHFLSVSGNNNNISFSCKRNNGNIVYLTGSGNNIRGTVSQIFGGTVLIRDTTSGSGACYSNIVAISAIDIQLDSILFNSIGVCAGEQIDLQGSGVAGYLQFTGDRPSITNRAPQWRISALNSFSVNGKTTNFYADASVPNTQISGELRIAHNFLYTPNIQQVSVTQRNPGVAPDAILQLSVGSASATEVVINYRWSSLPTLGGANAVVRIN